MKKLFLTLVILFIPLTIQPQFKNPENERKVDPLILKELRIIDSELDKGKILNKDLAKDNNIKWLRVNDNGRILVSVRFKTINVKSSLIDLGCEIKTEGKYILYVWVPYEKLENVVELEDVTRVRSIGIGTTWSVTSEGFQLHKGDLAQTNYGAYGEGIKVGVISDGIDEWQASYQNGDLPEFINIVDPGTEDGTEGTAMMEIIYDFAPQATYYFAGVEFGVDGPLDMANNILNLTAQGCKVIVDDLGWLEGYSYFEEKEISWAINFFVNSPNNGCYISSAGNAGDIMYSGIDYTWFYDQQDEKYYTYWDLVADKFNDIDLIDIKSMKIFFQWADDWDNPTQNFKMIWCDDFGNTLVESEGFSPEQVLTFDEGSQYLNGNYKLKIQSDNPAQEVELKILFKYNKNPENPNSNASIEYLTNSKHIFGHPIVDNVISVAAVNYNENQVEFFSSRGPAIISNGSSYTIENEQPKITGADGVSTFVWGEEGFSGTSASAPHIAGVAAQYFSISPNDSYSEFLFHLKSSALPLEDGNPNHWSIKSGYGIADSDGTIEHKYNSSAVYIRQLDENDIVFGEAEWYKWTVNPSHWEHFGPFEPISGASTEDERFRALQDFKEETYEKYHHWNKDNSPISNVMNHAHIPIANGNEILTAKFLEAADASVQISLDGAPQNNGTLKFKDPWYFENSAQYWEYAYGYRNMGMQQIPEEEISPLNLYTSTNYRGVFLHQLVHDGNYYSTEVEPTQTLSGKEAYFVNWTGTGLTGSQGIISPNSLNTPLVFKEDGAVVSANYHAAQQSSDPNAYLNNSQRKFVRSDNGYLHSVYESMGKAWYEISTDGGLTWQIANNGQPLSGSNESKLPAIDYKEDYVVIVWQQEDGGAYNIKIAKFFTGNYNSGGTIFMDLYLPYSSKTNPVVALDGEGRILVMWKRDEDNYGYWPVGIVFSYGTIHYGDQEQDQEQWVWNEMDFGKIPTTNSNSINPTLVADKDYNLIPAEYHLAWEQPAGFYTYVKYFELYRDGYNEIQSRFPATPSDGAGFWTNRKPSMIVVDDHTPRLVWIGYTPWYGHRTVFRAKQTNGLWSSTIINYGSYSTESVNINRTDDNNYAFVFSESYTGYQNKYVKNSNLWEMRNLGTTGKDIQVCNGADLHSMYCLAFQSNVTLPYRFVQSSSFGNLKKTTKKTESIGRAAIVTKDSAEFIYALGDVLLNDDPIKFKDVKDTIQINSQQELNNYLKSRPFHLEDGVSLTFGVVSGVVNPGAAAILLEEGKYVQFKVELIEDNTGDVLNTFGNLIYSPANVEEQTNLFFSLNTTGMSKTKVYIRILLDENISGEYTLSELIAEDSVFNMGKRGYQEISFGGNLAVTEYALEQNYPNPFNPSTTLKYQIPQNGFVTLKVYDILGKEVSSLVDEVKEQGRYEVNFNASSLASGVYLYRLTVNDYVDVKKMLLLK